MKNATLVEKGQFFRSYWKKSLNVQGCNTLFRGLSSPLLFKHRWYPDGGQAPTPPLHHQELRLVLRLLKELPFVCGDVCVWGGRGRAFLKKIQRNLGVRVHAFFFFFFFFFFFLFFLDCDKREREIEREIG